MLASMMTELSHVRDTSTDDCLSDYAEDGGTSKIKAAASELAQNDI